MKQMLCVWILVVGTVMGQMSETELEKASDGIATAVETPTATGEVIQSVPEPFTVPGHVDPKKAEGAKVSSFAQADANQDGKVTQAEFAAYLTNRKFAQFDKDGDGKLSQEEAKAATEMIKTASTGEKGALNTISIPFSDLDKDGDAHLSKEEVLPVIQQHPQVQTIYSEMQPKVIQQREPTPSVAPFVADPWVDMDSWNNYEGVSGGFPLLSFPFY
jgi:Ca2+-binding EF-hand superfamily protein